jgi:hypothetical protein
MCFSHCPVRLAYRIFSIPETLGWQTQLQRCFMQAHCVVHLNTRQSDVILPADVICDAFCLALKLPALYYVTQRKLQHLKLRCIFFSLWNFTLNTLYSGWIYITRDYEETVLTYVAFRILYVLVLSWGYVFENSNFQRSNVEEEIFFCGTYLNYLPVWPMKIPPTASVNEINLSPSKVLRIFGHWSLSALQRKTVVRGKVKWTVCTKRLT